MPIIINEFEIVTPQGEQSGDNAGSRPERQQTEASAGEQPRSEPLRPEDVERVMRRFYLRRVRLWAD
jgi:hypothetical protein